jgi:hypothetical protein
MLGALLHFQFVWFEPISWHQLQFLKVLISPHHLGKILQSSRLEEQSLQSGSSGFTIDHKVQSTSVQICNQDQQMKCWVAVSFMLFLTQFCSLATKKESQPFCRRQYDRALSPHTRGYELNATWQVHQLNSQSLETFKGHHSKEFCQIGFWINESNPLKKIARF